MTIKFLTGITFIAILFSTCSSHDPDADYSTSSSLAFNLVKTCVDKTLEIHTEFNTQGYLLDLSSISTLKQDAVDSFYLIKNAGKPASYDDSLIAVENKTLSRSNVLPIIIVQFDEIDYIDKRNVYVRMRKTRAANQVIRIGLDLRREGDIYRVIKSEIRR